jgi:hypothetical protein
MNERSFIVKSSFGRWIEQSLARCYVRRQSRTCLASVRAALAFGRLPNATGWQPVLPRNQVIGRRALPFLFIQRYALDVEGTAH